MKRQTVGVVVLAGSLLYSALALSGRFHPLALRMRAHGGVEHAVAVVLGSLSFKAVVLLTGAILAFWPAQKDREPH